MDELPNDHLSDVRKEFLAFYTTATPSDVVRMDVLLNTLTCLTLAVHAPRNPEDPLRDQLEKVTDATERAFTAAREEVRGCQTFKALCEGDRRRIESVLFSPYPEWER